MEEQGIVREITGPYANVVVTRGGECNASCKEAGCSCGSLNLFETAAGRAIVVKAKNAAGAREHDVVVLSLSDGAFFKGSLIAYIVPIILLLIGAWFGPRAATAPGPVDLVRRGGGAFRFADVRSVVRRDRAVHARRPIERAVRPGDRPRRRTRPGDPDRRHRDRPPQVTSPPAPARTDPRRGCLIALGLPFGGMNGDRNRNHRTPVRRMPVKRTTAMTLIGLALVALLAVSAWAEKGDASDDVKTVTTESGLKYQDLKVGDGATAVAGKKVTVHYTGWLTDETKFGQLQGPRQAVRLRAGRRPRHQRLGRGRRRDEGRRQAQADDPAGAGLRQTRRRAA